MSSDIPLGLLGVCLAAGVLGAGLGAWAFSHAIRAQLAAQRRAFEQAREQAQRDLQHALLCVPQWVQQAVRVELELLGRQQAERHKAQFDAQQRWQSAQDSRRQIEWRALFSGSAVSRPDPAPSPSAARVAPAASVLRTERGDAPRHPVSVCTAEALLKELSDEEIDALPPDLPAPAQAKGKKRQGPPKPVLHNI